MVGYTETDPLPKIPAQFGSGTNNPKSQVLGFIDIRLFFAYDNSASNGIRAARHEFARHTK